jgi:hypothetical protein
MHSQNFATHFLDEALSQNMAHIDDLFFLGNLPVALSILASSVIRRPLYLIRTLPPSSFMSLLVGFDRKVM